MFSLDYRLQVIEMTRCTDATAFAALIDHSYDVTTAVNSIFDRPNGDGDWVEQKSCKVVKVCLMSRLMGGFSRRATTNLRRRPAAEGLRVWKRRPRQPNAAKRRASKVPRSVSP